MARILPKLLKVLTQGLILFLELTQDPLSRSGGARDIVVLMVACRRRLWVNGAPRVKIPGPSRVVNEHVDGRVGKVLLPLHLAV